MITTINKKNRKTTSKHHAYTFVPIIEKLVGEKYFLHVSQHDKWKIKGKHQHVKIVKVFNKQVVD
jgi:hypothetical protein